MPSRGCSGVRPESLAPDWAQLAGPGALAQLTQPIASASAQAASFQAVSNDTIPQMVSAQEVLAWRRHQLAGRDRPAAALQPDLDWLLDLGGGVGWQQLQQLHLRPDQPVTLQRSLAALEALWLRHLNDQVPLQHLLGICPWRDLTLQVGPGALIPRAETELLIELALQCCPTPPSLWADLGSGSGAIALALARAWPASTGLAVELSDEARAIAAVNLQAAPQVQLLAGSWWQPLAPWWGQLELVVANPPYIPEAVWAELDPVVRDHEPALALASGADGLGAIRAIAAQASVALAPGGWLLLEHHHDQSAAVLDLLAAAGLQQLKRHRDLEGVWRFASGRAPG